MNYPELWNKCTAFHGHACGGLALGFRAACYAMELLELNFSRDEELVCIAENDACGIDAIQVALGCSVGKGNLLFHLTGKQAFNFYCRSTGRSVRLVAREKPAGLTKEESREYYLNTPAAELFDVKPTRLALPEPARLFETYRCDGCGEVTAAPWIHLQDGKKLCPDCYPVYHRFDL